MRYSDDDILLKMNHNHTHRTSYLLWPIGIFVLCAFLIAAVCYATFLNIYANEKADTSKTLVSVGQLKAKQIQSYLAERNNDAAVVSSFLTTASAQLWLTHQDDDPPATLNQFIDSMVAAYQYRGLLILDGEANILLNAGRGGLLAEAGKSIALRAMRERIPASFEIYFGDPSTPDEPVLDTFVPILTADGTKVQGMIVLRNELMFLFQTLQTWPADSVTAESLLVEKDGSDVLFLNDLRYMKGAAARFRVPLSGDASSNAWPAISAANGHFGLLEANDYRGERVLAYTTAVSGTPWSVVAKMDLDEAVAHSRRMLRVTLAIAATLIAFTGIIVWLWSRKYRADQLANRQLRESESRYRLLVESSPFCIHEIDLQGRLQSMNRAGLNMLCLDDANKICGMPYLAAVSEQDARRVEGLLRDAIDNGMPSHFEFAASGEEPLYFKSCFIPIKGASGKVLRLMGITEDITERKTSERRMRELTGHIQTIREEEKANIAREIHDDLGGTLTALKMEAYWLAEELSASKATEPLLKHVELISQLSDSAVNVARRVITGLRPTILDDLGLLAALEWQADQFHKHTGIECSVNSIEDKINLDRRFSIALFRIFQEALTNVARHSGASRVQVEFRCGDEEVMLSVGDNGRGMPEGHSIAQTSYGMRGMCERAEQLGGKIRFDSPSDGGLTVTVVLPLHAGL